MGVNTTADGHHITHQWLAAPAQANDIFYSVAAAQKAFPGQLSDEFVVFGHSQGGAVAWAAAERQASDPVPGYLGSVAASPVPDLSLFSTVGLSDVSQILALLARTVDDVFEDFTPDQWFTDEGLQYYNLLLDLQGCQSVLSTLFENPDVEYVRPEWSKTYYLNALAKLSNIGSKPFAGPLLVCTVQVTQSCR